MIKVLFICHGNICRSTMAEFVFKDMVAKRGLSSQFHIESAATSTEEIGNPVHPGTRRRLAKEGISCDGKYARQIVYNDYKEFDYLIGMDTYNIRNMKRAFCAESEDYDNRKIYKLLEFANESGDIADPWYTGNFDATYDDVVRGCEGLLKFLGF